MTRGINVSILYRQAGYGGTVSGMSDYRTDTKEGFRRRSAISDTYDTISVEVVMIAPLAVPLCLVVFTLDFLCSNLFSTFVVCEYVMVIFPGWLGWAPIDLTAVPFSLCNPFPLSRL